MKLFDPKRILIKVLLLICILLMVYNNNLITSNLELTHENGKLISKLIRRIDMFEFCYKLDLETIFKTIAEVGEFSIETNKGQIEIIKNITENISAMGEILHKFKEKLKEHEPIDDIENIKKANFSITNLINGYYGSGTHIKINNKNYVLTCAHLLKKETDEMITIVDDGKIYWLKLVKIDKRNDLALYSIAKNNLPYLKISKETPKEGSEVIIIGNPAGYNNVVTNGIIFKKTKINYTVTNLTYYGGSGGALLHKGKIVGVVSMIETFYNVKRHQYLNITKCINIETIRGFLEGIE